MDIEQNIINEARLAMPGADAICQRLEDIPVKPPYRKHVYWPPKRDNAEALVISIEARVSVTEDCDFSKSLIAKVMYGALIADPAGYYRLDKPNDQSHARLISCGREKTRVYEFLLNDSLLAYDSRRPIVIHAHEDIDLSYSVKNKPAGFGS
jgi:serine protease inhibitor ecotin